MPEEQDPVSAFERELELLGPIMARQEQAEAQEPDAEFLRALRGRLTGGLEQPEVAPPRPSILEGLREGLRRRWALAGGLSLAGAVAAVAVVLLLGQRGTGSTGTRSAVFHLPIPNKQQITRSYPLPEGIGAGGGAPPPWVTTVDPPPGAPYAGRLRLTARTLPAGTTRATAYRLQGPGFATPRIPSMARALGITSPVQRTVQNGVAWEFATDREATSQIHSVAVSLQTGELIYHNTRVTPVPVRPGAPPSAADIAAARAWLSRLGWPGEKMPIHPPASPLERDLSWTVRFDWPGASPADAPAAALVLGRNGGVIEAHLRPPVEAQEAIPTVTYASAWKEVREGKVPVGVENMMGPSPAAPGTGTVHTASLIYVLTPGAHGRLYLVPAYRFSGDATIPGVPGTRTWYAIVPAPRG